MTLNGIESNLRDIDFLAYLWMLLHNSGVINLIPLHRPSKTSKFRKSITIAFFSPNFNSCKSAISMEFKNSGAKLNV